VGEAGAISLFGARIFNDFQHFFVIPGVPRPENLLSCFRLVNVDGSNFSIPGARK
jgi:hypothetical protein